MFSASTLLTTLALTLVTSATPVVIRDSRITLAVAKHVNSTGSSNLVKIDQARAQALRARAQIKINGKLNTDAVISSPVDNQVVSYTATIGIGNPPNSYTVVVDTGSANLWIGALQPYVRTSSSVETSNRVSETSTSGSFSGIEFIDQVTIAPGLVIPQQSIGVASASAGFLGVDGGLGLGPTDLTLGTLSPATTSTIPTVTDNLFNLGLITAYEIAISFEPTTAESEENGEITWGGTDSTRFTGTIGFAPIPSTFPSSEFWGTTQSITYGASTPILASTVGIVDSSTTLLLIATDAFNRYRSATGAILDNTTGLLKITAAQFANLQSLFFAINGVTYEFTANAQIWPRALNVDIGGTSGSIYLIVGDIGSPTGAGLDFINGMVFLERFYTVFDSGNHRVGFATTPFTHATTN